LRFVEMMTTLHLTDDRLSSGGMRVSCITADCSLPL
jgi:hypothetical protein